MKSPCAKVFVGEIDGIGNYIHYKVWDEIT